MRQTLGVATSGLATLTRFGRGIFAKPVATKPELLLELYEFESCPYCRLVREVLTELDLDAMIYPCPKGGQRFRPRAVQLGGKAQFPFLVDRNTGERLYESADIIAYLTKTYGQVLSYPARRQSKTLDVASSVIVSGYRAGAGLRSHRRYAYAPTRNARTVDQQAVTTRGLSLPSRHEILASTLGVTELDRDTS